MRLRIGISGAGTAGAAAALMLARLGHEVTLFERVGDPQPVGAGILVQPIGLAVLRELGLHDEAVALGARIQRLAGEDHRGRRVLDMRYEHWRPGAFGLGMHRGALFALLQRGLAPAGVACRYGVEIVSLGREGGRLVAVDAAGNGHGTFDLVVAADGMRSPLRAASGLSARVTPYPWGAVWAICAAGDDVAGDVLAQRYRAARQMVGVLPTGRSAHGGAPLVSLFWSLPTASFAAWRTRGLAAWKAEVRGLWPALDPLLERIDDPTQLRFADYCDVTMPQWHGPGVVVIGDAAHATSPQLGQGANLALLDAWTLAQCLRTSRTVDAALAAYSARRRAHLRYFQWASRVLTPLFQSDRRLAPALRDTFMHWAGRLPYLRAQFAHTLAGTKTGLFSNRQRLPGE